MDRLAGNTTRYRLWSPSGEWCVLRSDGGDPLDLALTYFTDDPELEYARLLTDTVYLEAPPFFWQKQPRWKPGTGNCLENVRLLQNQPSSC